MAHEWQQWGECVIAKERAWVDGLPILGSIWLIGAIADRLWFAIDQSVPAWDQADYLTGALNYWKALQAPQWFSGEWWTSFWMLSSKIPPFVYISTTPFIGLFGAGADQATLVNLLYGAVLLASVYGLGIRLFSVQVGLWAAGLCLLLPGLYAIRLDFLIDFPLVALVTLSFWCLTMWWLASDETWKVADRWQPQATPQPLTDIAQASAILRFQSFGGAMPMRVMPWLWAAAFGVALGLALLTKQTTLFFLLTPIVWLGAVSIGKRRWIKLIQLVFGLAIALYLCFPWYRTNWLLILTSGKRATIDAAIAEGDPPLTSLAAWTFYLTELPRSVSLPILIIALVGLVLYWKRAVVSREFAIVKGRLVTSVDYGGLRHRGYRQDVYAAWWQSVRWLLIFLVGAYFLCSLNVNKDDRYIAPLLPVLAILLAQGLVLFPDRLRLFRWWAVGLAALLMGLGLVPSGMVPPLSDTYQHRAVLADNWHHADVVNDIIQTEPYLTSTVGVLPSVPEFNQHNLNYFGALRNFQVYGRQVGTNVRQVEQDARSLSWFVTKDGDQGSIRRPEAQSILTAAIAESPEFQLQNSWALPDRSQLHLYHRTVPTVQVKPGTGESAKVRLEQVRVPNQVAPGQPMPITYRWSGSWQELRSGLVLLTWHRDNERWFHDHAIALGNLQPSANDDTAQFQVVERLAALPPKTAQGTYTLKATYLNRETQETYEIAVPDLRLNLAANAPAPAPQEPDFVTQLRSLATKMPTGMKELSVIFEEINRLNQYDPVQDYVAQARQILDYRLQQEPQNREFAYGLALTNVLGRRVEPAIAALETVVKLDPTNPNAYAYLAFVNLYDFRPKAAQAAINAALALNPNLPELHTLNAVSGLMQGNLVQAWQEFRRNN
ncbi:glycosyltransferase family 39 protein [Myxacorys almedinensis]|uniref:Phospholipid carrier-dependent glycosyltransferase n=1 Tax=Myxacorys almedinensis A TaxID=2690445 RepID=A0A8J7Z6M3_9CYAN|nr:glycosyltransferase family 39 protein [Myxacorys almedinensis]NDJ18881.1 phospholipid carrier-dependent glycosyltransferase [Myxacorys almedinensis A]